MTNSDIQKAIIAAGYKALAKKVHPDRGGEAEDMIALNAARDYLLYIVKHSAWPPTGSTVEEQVTHTAPPGPPPVITQDTAERIVDLFDEIIFGRGRRTQRQAKPRLRRKR